MVWWRNDPESFRSFKRELEAFETLNIEISNDTIFIRGSWAVFGKESLIDRFDILVVIPDDFPNSVPKVYEYGGKLRKTPDDHFNQGDGSACLFAQPERYEKWPPGSGIRDFLNGPVREFFFSQAYWELNNRWPFDEWSHGDLGILEYYANFFEIENLAAVGRLLELATMPKIYRQWRCPCNNKPRLKTCHGEKLKRLKALIPKEELENAKRIHREFTDMGQKNVRILKRNEGF